MSRSRRAARGRLAAGADVEDERTSEEKEAEDLAAIDARRDDGDPICSSTRLSTLLFSYQKIYLPQTSLVTREDGVLGFYVRSLEHLSPGPVPEKYDADADEEGAKRSSEPAPPPPPPEGEPSMGFIRARTRIKPRQAILAREIGGLKEKIDEVDTTFQTLKVSLEFDAENMTETEKAAQTFQMRDLSRQLEVERSQLQYLKDELEREDEKGVAVYYSTADTEGRTLGAEDVLDNWLPPSRDELEEEARRIEELRNREMAKVDAVLFQMPKDIGGLGDNLRAAAELRIKKGIRLIRNDMRGPARHLDDF